MMTLIRSAIAGLVLMGAACAPEPPERGLPDGRADTVETAIRRVLDDPARPAYERDRDLHRQPLALFALLVLERGDTVLELGAGDGYQARLLSAAVGPDGRVVAVNAPAIAERLPQLHGSLETIAASDEGENIDVVVADFDAIDYADSLDAVVIGQFYHDAVWLGFDRTRMNALLFEALAPGGRLLVFDHAAEAGSGVRDAESLHRIDPALVRGELLAAGFELVEENDLLQNLDDGRAQSIFAPEIRGRTDRFTYIFQKPANRSE